MCQPMRKNKQWVVDRDGKWQNKNALRNKRMNEKKRRTREKEKKDWKLSVSGKLSVIRLRYMKSFMPFLSMSMSLKCVWNNSTYNWTLNEQAESKTQQQQPFTLLHTFISIIYYLHETEIFHQVNSVFAKSEKWKWAWRWGFFLLSNSSSCSCFRLNVVVVCIKHTDGSWTSNWIDKIPFNIRLT